MQSPTAPIPARYAAPAPTYNPTKAHGTLLYANPPSTPKYLPTTSQPATQAQDQQLTAIQPPATISWEMQKLREEALAARALKKGEEHTAKLNKMTRENNHLRSQGLIVEKEKEKVEQTVKELERQNAKLRKDVLAEKKRGSTSEASALALQESLRLEKRETLRLSSLIGKPAIKETRRQMGVVHNLMVCKKNRRIKTYTQRQARLIALVMKENIDQTKVMSYPEHTIQNLNDTHQSNISQLNSEYQQHIQNLQAELESANSHLAKLHPQAQEFSGKIEALEIKLKGAQECVSTERNNASELGLTVSRLKTDLNNSASEIKALNQKLSENNDLETKLREANDATEKERTKNAELVNRINGINTDLEERQSKIEDLNEKLKNKGDLESEIQAAKDEISHEHVKNSTFETTIANLKTKLGDLECENKNLEEKRASLEAQLHTSLKDRKSGGFENTEVALHNADPQEDTAEDIVGLESGHLDNSDPTGSTPNNEQHQKLDVKKGSPQPRSRRADRSKSTRPNTPPPGPRRGRDETEEVYTLRLRLLTEFLMGYNSKLLGQDKGHSAVSDLETTRFQNIDEFISDPTECFVAMREKLDASFSKNCDLNHKIDQMEDSYSQESKKLKSRVKKLEATVDGLRQEIEEEKRNKNKKLSFREQALAKAEKALEQRKKKLDSAESELAAVTTAESSTDSWDKETDDNGSTIFGDARISEGDHAVEQNSMFADNWDNGDRVVDSPTDRIEARSASPIKDMDAKLPTTPGALSWKLILVFILLLAVRVAVIVYPTVSEQNPPSYQHLPDTCHMSDKPTALALPDPLPILVCLSDKSSNATPPPASILMFDSAKYSHNLPQLEESCDDPKGSGTIWGSCKTWLWNFVLKGDLEERVGVAAGRRDLYL
jgi:predicted  nucleic acid-binding Zn-ribbon protein